MIMLSVVVVAILVLVGFLATFGFLSIKGDISISSSPSGASIYLDNIYQGETPKALKNIEHGSHNITLILAGYANWSQTINVDAGKTTSISQTLTPIPLPEVRINYDSNTVQINENISGTAKNIPDGYELWILVYPYAANRYYPQHDKVNIQNGEWSLPVGIGTEDNVGYKFDIIAVLADKEARAEFTSYIINCENTDKWPGMKKIPVGAKVYDRVIVIRKPPPKPEIKINYPSNTAHVKENITGTANYLPDNSKIWIIVYPHNNKYYPQSEANIQSGGGWSLPQPVYIGTENDTGLQFDIIAVLVDQQSQDEFKNYYERCKKTNKWFGMDEIPDNAKEYARITVTRV